MIKNKYLLPEEVRVLITQFTKRRGYMKKVILLIYSSGYTVSRAAKTVNRSVRACEFSLEAVTGGKITLGELRKSWKLSNPDLLYKKLQAKHPKKRDCISPSLRWKVLARDGFKCIACGVHSKDTILHVDHTVPQSLGGETDLANLRALCGECNLGRGSLLLPIDLQQKYRHQ